MTTITPPLPRSLDAPAARSRRGFTLVEVLISAGLVGFILTGVMTTFLFLGRSGANLQNYNDMESQARKALELFAQDTRQASSITWTSNNELTLVVDSTNITYRYASERFTRNGVVLLSGVVAPVARTSETDTTCTPFFRAYDINGNQIKAIEYASPSATVRAAAGKSTKQLQISLEASRTTRTVARATNLVLSARFVLRNKRITA